MAYLPLTPPVISLCRSSAFFFSCRYSQPFFFFVSYLHPPLLLLAGRLGADKFGREQAKGGQTRSLCVYIEGTERCWGGGDVATTDTVQLRPGGGLWQKIKYCAFVLWSCGINR